MQKICEMAAVMHKAASLDDDEIQHSTETLGQLRAENCTLREVLHAAYVNAPQPVTIDAASQTEGQDQRSSTSESQNSDSEDVHNFGCMDESYTSMDSSFDNPMQRSVIEVFKAGTKLERQQDENANSSSASSDIDIDNSLVAVVSPVKA